MAAKKKKKKKKKKAAKAPKKAKRTVKKAARKAATRKAAPTKRSARAKKTPKREFGEGNYKASKRFRTKQEAFVKTNKSRILALGRKAKKALEGSEGADLMSAAAQAAAHAAGQS